MKLFCHFKCAIHSENRMVKFRFITTLRRRIDVAKQKLTRLPHSYSSRISYKKTKTRFRYYSTVVGQFDFATSKYHKSKRELHLSEFQQNVNPANDLLSSKFLLMEWLALYLDTPVRWTYRQPQAQSMGKGLYHRKYLSVGLAPSTLKLS